MTAPDAGRPVDAAGQPHYRPFGTFRMLLALIVVCNHAGWIAKGTSVGDIFIGERYGSIAVLTFFILSGYIMSEAASTFYANRPVNFAKNRVLKIAPPFLGALILSLIVHVGAYSQDAMLAAISFEGYKAIPDDMFGFWNLAYNPLSIQPVITLDFVKRLTHSDLYLFVRYIWAVRVEVLFYTVVFLALALPSMQRFLGKDRHLKLALGFSAFMLIDQFVYSFSWDIQFASYFLFGVLVYFGPARVAHFWAAVSIAVALMLCHSFQFMTGKVPFSAGWSDEFVKRSSEFALFAALIVLFLVLRKARLPSSLSRADRALGDLSYSLYLNQYAVLVAFSALSLTPSMPQLTWLAVVAVCVAVAALMHLVVERPLISLRDRLRGQEILSGSSDEFVDRRRLAPVQP